MGTPNITGQYEGFYDIVIRSSDPNTELGQLQAYSGPQGGGIGQVDWSFDFSSSPKTVTLTDGRLTAKAGLPDSWFDYHTQDVAGSGGVKPLPFVDNLDGTYTVTYYFSVTPGGGGGSPAASTTITLEITKLTDNSIAVVTVPGTNCIPGTPLSSPPFFRNATPDWQGRAEEV